MSPKIIKYRRLWIFQLLLSVLMVALQLIILASEGLPICLQNVLAVSVASCFFFVGPIFIQGWLRNQPTEVQAASRHLLLFYPFAFIAGIYVYFKFLLLAR